MISTVPRNTTVPCAPVAAFRNKKKKRKPPNDNIYIVMERMAGRRWSAGRWLAPVLLAVGAARTPADQNGFSKVFARRHFPINSLTFPSLTFLFGPLAHRHRVHKPRRRTLYPPLITIDHTTYGCDWNHRWHRDYYHHARPVRLFSGSGRGFLQKRNNAIGWSAITCVLLLQCTRY